MTFLEAAIQILQGSDEPLHITEIARIAVERKLLSHVGRDPEAAMRSCLNSAVRGKAHGGLVMRSKPGHFRLRPGVEVPELPDPPTEAEPLPEPKAKKTAKKSSAKKTAKKSSAKKSTAKKSAAKKKVSKNKKKAAKISKRPKKSSGRSRKQDEPDSSEEQAVEAAGADEVEGSEAVEEVAPAEQQAEVEVVPTLSAANLPEPDLDPSKVRFRGPEGSGLEGDTDVALVMANAMSRLVEERPELREELEAMQKPQAPAIEVIEVGRKRRRDDDGGREDRGRDEERGGRRRRRRRRRNRRVEWSGGNTTARAELTHSEELLDKVAATLREAGPRSLHVRQIAESLAAQDILGGEISEIERAVTAALLLDVHQRGDGSRFAVRGDARYQLRGSRLPEKAAAAEQGLRDAARALEKETRDQLLAWLQSLGARALESLVRIWLATEKFKLVATLPPSRGLGKLIVEDPDPEEDDGRTLVLIFPRKTSLEPKLWDGEAERNNCSNTLVFAMCEPSESLGEARVVFAREFSEWLLRHGVGVKPLKIEVPALDANLIESIGGLDT